MGLKVKYKFPPELDFTPLAPAGWYMLVQPLEADEKTESGLYIAQETQKDISDLMSIGKVIAQGPLCYTDERFKGQKFCEVGDYIIYGRHQGIAYQHRGVTFKLLYDDRVVARIDKEEIEKIDGSGNYITYGSQSA